MWNNKINPIQQVIDQGLELMRKADITEDLYQAWIDYSRAMLNIATKNPAIYANYSTVILSATMPNIPIYQRLSMCIQYLIRILPIL